MGSRGRGRCRPAPLRWPTARRASASPARHRPRGCDRVRAEAPAGRHLRVPERSALGHRTAWPGRGRRLRLSDSLSTATVLAVGGSLFAVLEPRSAVTAYLVAFGLPALLALLGVQAGRRTTP